MRKATSPPSSVAQKSASVAGSAQSSEVKASRATAMPGTLPTRSPDPTQLGSQALNRASLALHETMRDPGSSRSPLNTARPTSGPSPPRTPTWVRGHSNVLRDHTVGPPGPTRQTDRRREADTQCGCQFAGQRASPCAFPLRLVSQRPLFTLADPCLTLPMGSQTDTSRRVSNDCQARRACGVRCCARGG